MMDNNGGCCGFDQMDCSGLCDGAATVDGCGTCDADPTNDCCGGPNAIQCPANSNCVADPANGCDPNADQDCPGICQAGQGCAAGQIEDRNGVCCTQDELDCDEVCNGGNVEAVDGACCAAEEIDCDGECFSQSRVDACGVCRVGTPEAIDTLTVDVRLKSTIDNVVCATTINLFL